MSHSHSRIAGSNKDIFISGIAANEGKTINRLHHLPGPTEFDFFNRETIARPLLEFSKALTSIVLLARLMVFAADNQNVIVLTFFEPYIMVGFRHILRSVPQQYRRN